MPNRKPSDQLVAYPILAVYGKGQTLEDGMPEPEQTQCPHCGIAFHHAWNSQDLGQDEKGLWRIRLVQCPTCEQFVIELGFRSPAVTSPYYSYRMVHPRVRARMRYSDHIGHEFYDDYLEACEVLPISSKSSAALSRRLLQHILREKAEVKHGSLDAEITEFLEMPRIPNAIAQSVDAVRHVGNFAAHPIKSNSSGEVVSVEPGEAEWNLETLEQLFDYYFLTPAKLAARRESLNQKLRDAGKPELK